MEPSNSDISFIHAPITQEEAEEIKKFKEMIVTAKQNVDFSYFEDFYFLRFLRSKNKDFKKAFENWTNYFNWFILNDGYNIEVIY